MSMDGKVMPSKKVSSPNGPLGTYPQHTPPNPSQRGMNAPAEPSRNGMDGNNGGGAYMPPPGK